MVQIELIDTCWDVNLFPWLFLAFSQKELIDTCWDVNTYTSDSLVDETSGINRYMLGCKFDASIVVKINRQELIDTCWDVNVILKIKKAQHIKELIDTCWDVNYFKYRR